MLVINNVNFLFSKDSRPRNGANHDRDNIRAFVKEAGFENVVERSDLSGEEMLELMEKTRQIGDLGESILECPVAYHQALSRLQTFIPKSLAINGERGGKLW